MDEKEKSNLIFAGSFIVGYYFSVEGENRNCKDENFMIQVSFTELTTSCTREVWPSVIGLPFIACFTFSFNYDENSRYFHFHWHHFHFWIIIFLRICLRWTLRLNSTQSYSLNTSIEYNAEILVLIEIRVDFSLYRQPPLLLNPPGAYAFH